MKYKVMSDSASQFVDIEIDYVIEDFTIGRELMFLGGKFTLQQNGKILVLANADRVITIMDVTPIPKEIGAQLIINDTVELYLETREIAVKTRCTYYELFHFLKREWILLHTMTGQIFPFEYDDTLQLFTFKDGWNFEGGNFSMLSEGSFSRENGDGRSI